MIVKKFDISSGLTVYNNVKLIRVKNKKNNYLIMEDHAPIIGKVEGIITILREDDNDINLNVSGYFMHKLNTFELIVEGVLDDGEVSDIISRV